MCPAGLAAGACAGPHPPPHPGRVEIRTLKVVTVRGLGFLHASQVRSGTAPQVMACLRNLAIGVLCRAGPVNLAAALRFHAATPTDPWRP